MYNQDMLDTLSLLAFVIGLANYRENLSQSDKDDIMNKLDEQTKDILIELTTAIEEQNAMLKEILRRLDDGKR